MSTRTTRGVGTNKPWWSGHRLQDDIESVKRFNQPRLLLHTGDDGKPFWRGPFVVTLPHKTLEIELEINYPERYPRQLPRVKDVQGHYQKDSERHIESDHTFCLTPMAVGEEIPIHEPFGFEKFLGAVLGFLVRQEQYELTKRWPGPAVAHGLDGLVQYHHVQCFPTQPDWETTAKLIKEWRREGSIGGRLQIKRDLGLNALCPCSSGRKLKRCHGPIVDCVVQRCNETFYDFK